MDLRPMETLSPEPPLSPSSGAMHGPRETPWHGIASGPQGSPAAGPCDDAVRRPGTAQGFHTLGRLDRMSS